MKTLTEITEALSHEYDGPTEEKDGFTYIPWAAAVDKANHIFGIGGWDVEVRDCHLETIVDPIEHSPTYQYVATVRVHVHPSDGEGFYRDGVGTNDVQFTKAREYTDRKTGEVVHVSPKALIDTAAKGAASDATTRGLRLFGRALGLGINLDVIAAKAHGITPAKTNYSPTAKADPTATKATGPLGYRPSAAQQKFLSSLGWTPEMVATMPAAEWKAKLDTKERYKAPTPVLVTSSTQSKSSDDFDDLDDFLSNN